MLAGAVSFEGLTGAGGSTSKMACSHGRLAEDPVPCPRLRQHLSLDRLLHPTLTQRCGGVVGPHDASAPLLWFPCRGGHAAKAMWDDAGGT